MMDKVKRILPRLILAALAVGTFLLVEHFKNASPLRTNGVYAMAAMILVAAFLMLGRYFMAGTAATGYFLAAFAGAWVLLVKLSVFVVFLTLGTMAEMWFYYIRKDNDWKLANRKSFIVRTSIAFGSIVLYALVFVFFSVVPVGAMRFDTTYLSLGALIYGSATFIMLLFGQYYMAGAFFIGFWGFALTGNFAMLMISFLLMPLIGAIVENTVKRREKIWIRFLISLGIAVAGFFTAVITMLKPSGINANIGQVFLNLFIQGPYAGILIVGAIISVLYKRYFLGGAFLIGTIAGLILVNALGIGGEFIMWTIYIILPGVGAVLEEMCRNNNDTCQNNAKEATLK